MRKTRFFLCNILNISYRDLSTHISTFSDLEESSFRNVSRTIYSCETNHRAQESIKKLFLSHDNPIPVQQSNEIAAMYAFSQVY